jgi:hypothetical protein
MARLTVYAALLVAIVEAACVHRSQSREYRTRSEDSCRSAAAQAAGGTDSFSVFATLAWCDESGPATLSARWARALPRDSLAARTFLFASANVQDGRVFDAAFRAAADSARPDYERGAALLVLAAQFDASAAIMFQEGAGAVPWRATLGRYTHALQMTGAVPLPSDARRRVSVLVASILDHQPGGLRRSIEPLYGAALETRYALQDSR